MPKTFEAFQRYKQENSYKYKRLEYLYRNRNNILTNAVGQKIIEVSRAEIKGFPDGITQTVNSKGGINRNYYGPDGLQIKQISNNGHGHKKEESFGIKGEHAHDYIYNEKGELVERRLRELSDKERKENSDIL